MKVWVVTTDMSHEGESIMGVYSTLEAAKSRATVIDKEWENCSVIWATIHEIELDVDVDSRSETEIEW
jgi:hypothetical protein